MDQWNRIDSLKVNAHKCCELIFDKCVKAVVPVPFVLEGVI